MTSNSVTSAGRAVEVGDDDALATQLDDLVLAELDREPRVRDERRDVGREEVLALAATDDQRAVATRSDDDVGLVGVDGHEGERTRQPTAHGAHRLGEVASDGRQRRGEQVRDDLGVGLGAQVHAVGGELGAQLGEVLDDAVVDDGDLAVLAHVRVRVLRRSGRRGWPSACARCRSCTAAAGRCRAATRGSRACRPSCGCRAAPSDTTATPAESYPRYSSRRSPSTTTCRACFSPTYPTIPHMGARLPGAPGLPASAEQWPSTTRREAASATGLRPASAVAASTVSAYDAAPRWPRRRGQAVATAAPGRRGGLDHHADDGLRARRAQQHATVARSPPPATAARRSVGRRGSCRRRGR